MSRTTIAGILLIVLLNNGVSVLRLTSASSPCDLSSAINLQSVTYSHSLVVRVQPIPLSDDDDNQLLVRHVLVREVIKSPMPMPSDVHPRIKPDDIVIIRITNENDGKSLDDSCWHLLRVPTVDIILFLNATSASNQFDLYYPPVESTFRVRENIDAVLNQGKCLLNMQVLPRSSRDTFTLSLSRAPRRAAAQAIDEREKKEERGQRIFLFNICSVFLLLKQTCHCACAGARKRVFDHSLTYTVERERGRDANGNF